MIALVRFGSGFIYARINLNLYMETRQKKMALLKFSFDSSLSIWIRKLVDLQFPSHSLNTEFEHRI